MGTQMTIGNYFWTQREPRKRRNLTHDDRAAKKSKNGDGNSLSAFDEVHSKETETAPSKTLQDEESEDFVPPSPNVSTSSHITLTGTYRRRLSTEEAECSLEVDTKTSLLPKNSTTTSNEQTIGNRSHVDDAVEKSCVSYSEDRENGAVTEKMEGGASRLVESVDTQSYPLEAGSGSDDALLLGLDASYLMDTVSTSKDANTSIDAGKRGTDAGDIQASNTTVVRMDVTRANAAATACNDGASVRKDKLNLSNMEKDEKLLSAKTKSSDIYSFDTGDSNSEDSSANNRNVERSSASCSSWVIPRRSVRQQSLHERDSNRKNIQFYMNEIESVPRGATIDVILRDWKGNYNKLESHHGYIQWLFPLPESGLNLHAQPLQTEEAKFLQSNEAARKRMITAYRMMLDFYGMKLNNDNSGEISHAKNWKERMAHLNRSSHNFLRITRILKCFGEVGFEHFQAPFVAFLIKEAFQNRTLVNGQRSCRMFWVPSVEDTKQRDILQDLIDKFSDYSSRL